MRPAILSCRTLLFLGVALGVAGLAWHMAFAGLPYPDPSPEVYARWRLNSRIADALLIAGLGLGAGAIALAIIARARARLGR